LPNITIGPGGLLPAREESNKYDLTALPIFEPAREECNKDDLTALPILEWPNSNGQTRMAKLEWPNITIGPGGLLLVVPTYLQ
jgi:hypothetical protein